MARPTKITKPELEKLYLRDKKSVLYISKIYGISIAQVSRYLKNYKIESRPFSTTGIKTRLGKKLSNESKEKIRQKAIGRRIPVEVRKKMGSKGSKNARYIDGRTPLNKLIRHSLEYKLWREAVFERDNYKCRFCEKRGGNLQADHIKPFAYYPELRLAIDNGRTLCVECHRKTDTYGHKCKHYQS